MQTRRLGRTNHASAVGPAEERIGPWTLPVSGQFFLGCKTMERDAAGGCAGLLAEQPMRYAGRWTSWWS